MPADNAQSTSATASHQSRMPRNWGCKPKPRNFGSGSVTSVNGSRPLRSSTARCSARSTAERSSPQTARRRAAREALDARRRHRRRLCCTQSARRVHHVGRRDQGRFRGRHSACFRPSLRRDLARLRAPGERLRRRAVERNYGPVKQPRNRRRFTIRSRVPQTTVYGKEGSRESSGSGWRSSSSRSTISRLFWVVAQSSGTRSRVYSSSASR